MASVRAENNPEQTPDIKRNDITGMNVYRQDEREYYYFDLSPEHLPKSIKSLEEKVEQSLIELNMKNLELNAGVLLGLGSDSPLALCGHVIAKSQKRDFAGLAEYYEKLAELEDSYVKKWRKAFISPKKVLMKKLYDD
ncbi:MAG: hypothetical protein HWD59_10510 [Coxiellaceae bacterium]|nr:MAG: hypothetical protein HWD59_10510 [Coxiellaceae bacterium]